MMMPYFEDTEELNEFVSFMETFMKIISTRGDIKDTLEGLTE